jgi:hypothetical protein
VTWTNEGTKFSKSEIDTFFFEKEAKALPHILIKKRVLSF